MSVEKIRIGISSCLLGEKVRFDGQHKLDRFIVNTLGEYFDFVPVCPEVELGLPTPRPALRLVGEPEGHVEEHWRDLAVGVGVRSHDILDATRTAPGDKP